MKLHPWELSRYTLREFYYRLKYLIEEDNREIELQKVMIRENWEQTRWSVMHNLNAWGSKISSPYRLIRFSWDPKPTPPPPPGTYIGKFPKKLTPQELKKNGIQ